jgi:hypothetical protein
MNTNFIHREEKCVDYIYRKSLEDTTNQEIVDTFLAVYSKKYLGDKSVLKNTLYAYTDAERFKVNPGSIFDPKLLLLSNNTPSIVWEKLNKKEWIQWTFVHNLSKIHIWSYEANFGFILSQAHTSKIDYFWYITLDKTILIETPTEIIDALYDLSFIANHDYIHALSLWNETSKEELFTWNIPNTIGMNNYEYMSLCFHYALFQDIYKKQPHLKEKVIEDATLFVEKVESCPQLDNEQINYLIWVYIYFLRRILSPADRPASVKKYLTTLVIEDTYPVGENITTNSEEIHTVYQNLKRGNTIIPKNLS